MYMIRGIDSKPYINLDSYLPVSKFKDLHPEIARGFACAREHAKEGTWMAPGFDWKDASYIMNWKTYIPSSRRLSCITQRRSYKSSWRSAVLYRFKRF